MKIRILTDTSSGIQIEDAESKNIELTHMPIIFGEEEFIDGLTLSNEDFYNKMVKEGIMPKTALINKQQFMTVFEDVKNNNQSMVVFPISKHLSATYENAMQALKSVGYDNIFIVDTLQTTIPLAALVFEAERLRKEGKSAKEIFEICNNLSSKIKVVAIVKTLKYLHAGGRLSRTSAILGTMLNLKPIVSIVEGKVANIHKCIGQKSACAFVIKKFQTDVPDFTKPIYFCHSNNVNECTHLKDMFKNQKYIDGGFYDIGSTVASHTGPGVIGLVYFTK